MNTYVLIYTHTCIGEGPFGQALQSNITRCTESTREASEGAEGAASPAQSTPEGRRRRQTSVQREAPWKSAFMVITLSHSRAPLSKVFTRLCKGPQIRAESRVRGCQRNLSVWIVTPDLYPDKKPLGAPTRSTLPLVFV